MNGNDLVMTPQGAFAWLGLAAIASRTHSVGVLSEEVRRHGDRHRHELVQPCAKDIDPKTDLVPAAIYKSSGLQKLAAAWLQDNYNSPSDLFNGPYMLKQWSADQRVFCVLAANPYYTALPADPKHPRPAIIQEVVLSEDGPTYIQDLKAASTYNTIDVAQDFTVSNIPDLKSTKYQTVVQPGLTYELLESDGGLQTYKGQKNPLADIRVRQALNFAINKEQFLAALFPTVDPKSLELSSPYPGASPWSINSKLPQNVYNPGPRPASCWRRQSYATSTWSGRQLTSTRTMPPPPGPTVSRQANSCSATGTRSGSTSRSSTTSAGRARMVCSSAWADGGRPGSPCIPDRRTRLPGESRSG